MASTVLKMILDGCPGARSMQREDIALSTPEAFALDLNVWIEKHKIVESW
jgi:hypothetical protein